MSWKDTRSLDLRALIREATRRACQGLGVAVDRALVEETCRCEIEAERRRADAAERKYAYLLDGAHERDTRP